MIILQIKIEILALIQLLNYSVITSASSSLPDGFKGFFIVSWIGVASFMNNPEYEWAGLFQRCLNDGITVVALESIAEIGSPKYRILSGDVLLSDVQLLAISVDTFLPTYISI